MKNTLPVKLLMVPFAAFLLICSLGCPYPPPPAPGLGVTIISAAEINYNVAVQCDFTGPANTTAAAGYEAPNGQLVTIPISFDAAGKASYTFNPLGYAAGQTITIGVSNDGGKTMATDSATIL